MSIIELKFLIFSQLGIDIILILVFVIVIRRLKYFYNSKSLAKTLQSFVSDTEKLAVQFNEQLMEKQRLINNLNEQLDKRIGSLNILLNRADILLSRKGTEVAGGQTGGLSSSNHQTEIIAMAKEGCPVEEIASRLSVPKGEVKLVLDLKKTMVQNNKE
jgi:hypothetical protein